MFLEIKRNEQEFSKKIIKLSVKANEKYRDGDDSNLLTPVRSLLTVKNLTLSNFTVCSLDLSKVCSGGATCV